MPRAGSVFADAGCGLGPSGGREWLWRARTAVAGWLGEHEAQTKDVALIHEPVLGMHTPLLGVLMWAGHKLAAPTNCNTPRLDCLMLRSTIPQLERMPCSVLSAHGTPSRAPATGRTPVQAAQTPW